MKNKLTYLIYCLVFISLNSIAVDVTYSTFQLTDEMYGVHANIVFNSKIEKTAAASLEIDDALECGKTLHNINKDNPFFIKRYLVENIEEIDLKSNSNLFWIIQSNSRQCLEQTAININLIVKAFELDSIMKGKPMRVEDIKISNLNVSHFKYPVSLNKHSVNRHLQGIVNWGEVDGFSNYGRLYFKFIWDNEAGPSPYNKLSDYQLECLNNKGKIVKKHHFLIKPSLIRVPALKDQTIHIFPLIFIQGEKGEYFERCDASLAYEINGTLYKTLGVWLNDIVK